MKHVGLCLLIFTGMLSEGRCENWRWSSRLDGSIVHDNNVLESISNPFADFTGRFLTDVTSHGRVFQSLNVFMQYRGGLETYKSYSEENRMVNDIQGNLTFPIHPEFSAGLNFQARNKLFFSAHRGYWYVQSSPFIRWKFPYNVRVSLFHVLSFLDYADGVIYDYLHQGAGVRIECAVTRSFNWNISWTFGNLRFDREAQDYEPIDLFNFQWTNLDKKQKDHHQELSTSIELYYWILLRIQYAYERNMSNSYGFTYNRPKFNILAAKNLKWGFTLRFYWNMLLKKYSDSLQPILQIRPDTENEENSFLLVDLSKDITKNMSVRFRMGWYRNESPFRDLYYEKTLISGGLSHRF